MKKQRKKAKATFRGKPNKDDAKWVGVAYNGHTIACRSATITLSANGRKPGRRAAADG